METSLALEQYFRDSIDHRNLHKCGGMPFENGGFLTQCVKELGNKNILEIGTAIGYSATCFALGSQTADITTIDLHQRHSDIAYGYWEKFEVSGRIKAIARPAIEVLPELNSTFDLIFFDGFAPDPNFAKHFAELVAPEGLIISSNLELPAQKMTGPKYLEKLASHGLKTIQNSDIAFSSFDLEVVNCINDLWGNPQLQS